MTTYNDAGYALIREYAPILDLRCPLMGECRRCGNAPYTLEDKIAFIEFCHNPRDETLLEFLEDLKELFNNGGTTGMCPVDMND